MTSSSSLTTPRTSCGHRGEVRMGREEAESLCCLLSVISSRFPTNKRNRCFFFYCQQVTGIKAWLCLFVCVFFVCVFALQSCCPTRRRRGWMTSSSWCSSSTPPCASRSTNSAKNASWLDGWRTSTLNSAPWRRSCLTLHIDAGVHCQTHKPSPRFLPRHQELNGKI